MAATPRTGSSLLCEGLAATGIAGAPSEIFAPHLRAWWLQQLSLREDADFQTYLDAALAYATTPNGVAAFKMHWLHLGELAEEVGCAVGDALESILPGARSVRIVRGDRRAQALSWFRAEATNEWFRLDRDVQPSRPPRLDLDEVRRLEADIAGQEASWHAYFESRGIVPLTVVYEALAEDYRGTVGRVLEFLGLDRSAAARIAEPLRIRQADAVTERWRRRLDRAAGGAS